MNSKRRGFILLICILILNLISKICERYISPQKYMYLNIIFLIIFSILLIGIINEGLKFLDKRNDK